MNTIARHWQDFEKVVLKNASPQQRKEMRIAFYGGASAVLAIEIQIAQESDAAGVAMLEGLHEETRAFAAELVAGRPR